MNIWGKDQYSFFLSDNLKLIFKFFKIEVKQKHGRDGAVSKGKVNKKNNWDSHSTLPPGSWHLIYTTAGVRYSCSTHNNMGITKVQC